MSEQTTLSFTAAYHARHGRNPVPAHRTPATRPASSADPTQLDLFEEVPVSRAA